MNLIKSSFSQLLPGCLMLTFLMLTGPLQSSETGTEITIDKSRLTVSGISAGGQMAHQLHIAYSDLFSGAAIIAGGPYGCADGSLGKAMARCMGQTNGSLAPDDLFKAIKQAEESGQISPTAALSDDPVWLFHGTLDTVVAEKLSDDLAALYSRFIPDDQIRYVKNVQAAHNFPVSGEGESCTVSSSPFIGHCEYDAAGELLNHLYPSLEAPQSVTSSPLAEVNLPGAEEAGLSKTAYLFIPPACRDGKQACATHLVLHGCAQSVVQIGTTFIEQSGYLPWALANDIVLAFPQVVSGPTNPFACWDWWGYTGAEYRWRNGAQMKVLADWISGL
jgi:hypothetical protein